MNDDNVLLGTIPEMVSASGACKPITPEMHSSTSSNWIHVRYEIKSQDIFSSDLFTYKYKSCHSV